MDNDNENIRRFVCFYLTQTQSKSSLRKLLDRYLTHGPYFYNVVALLDRALYAPVEILDFYVREEKQFFERWRPSNRWQLDDFLLKKS